MVTIQVKTARNGVVYNYKQASAPRLCKHGCTIQPGQRYLREYDVKGKTIRDSWNHCTNHFRFCENCGSPFFDIAGPIEGTKKRFCSDECGQAHFDRAAIDAEENSFWERE